MPKGDRLKLKADPEDGTTPIANLLLEAVAMARLSGLQKGAILYLWRRTYGWVEDGKRLKERKIGLAEWKNALDSTKPRVSVTLSALETKGIIRRRIADTWGGYYYSINTDVKTWNSDCLNIAKLSETVITNPLPTVTPNGTVTQLDNSYPNEEQLPKTQLLLETELLPKKRVTVTQNVTEQLPKTQPPTLYKERLNKDIKKETHPLKNIYGEFHNVLLTEEEHGKLLERYRTKPTEVMIESLSAYLQNKHKKYNSHYATLLTWFRREERDGAHQGNNQRVGNAKTNSAKDSQRDYTSGKYGAIVEQ